MPRMPSYEGRDHDAGRDTRQETLPGPELMIPPDRDCGDASSDADRGGDAHSSKTVMKGTGGKGIRASPPEVSQREAGRGGSSTSSLGGGDSRLGANSQGEAAPCRYPGPHTETALRGPSAGVPT
ncbi:uncharacterized protein LOC143280218 [Babylonia areolata]|uniref:uncharacterized protein LOC143280218 n=1 Tax=Babylonia areolata TaxID=304850 RepID=UPI003FD1736A